MSRSEAEAVRPGDRDAGAGDSFAKLDPRHQMRNPVMFVVFVGTVLTTLLWSSSASRGSPAGSSSAWRSGCGSRCCSPTSPRRWPRGTARPRRTRCGRPARHARPRSSPSRATTRSTEIVSAGDAPQGRLVLVEAGDFIPVDGEVVEGVASVDESAITGERAPVIRESGGDRICRHRRHPGALRLARRARHRQPGRDLPRPDDRDGRRREAAEDAERDRPEHPARRPHDHLPAGDGDAAAVLALQP